MMTEQQTAIKELRKIVFGKITKSLKGLNEDQRNKLKEFLELNVDIKKNKITISLPYSYAQYLEKGLE